MPGITARTRWPYAVALGDLEGRDPTPGLLLFLGAFHRYPVAFASANFSAKRPPSPAVTSTSAMLHALTPARAQIPALLGRRSHPNGAPIVKRPPKEVWINKPTNHPDAHPQPERAAP
jgi:hypothetical protein